MLICKMNLSIKDLGRINLFRAEAFERLKTSAFANGRMLDFVAITTDFYFDMFCEISDNFEIDSCYLENTENPYSSDIRINLLVSTNALFDIHRRVCTVGKEAFSKWLVDSNEVDSKGNKLTVSMFSKGITGKFPEESIATYLRFAFASGGVDEIVATAILKEYSSKLSALAGV